MSTDEIILLCWFTPVLFFGRFGARWMIDYFDDGEAFVNGGLGWMFSFFWPILLPIVSIYKLYQIAPGATRYLVVARPPKEKKKKDELAELKARNAELERELEL